MNMALFMASDVGVERNTLSILKFLCSFIIEWE